MNEKHAMRACITIGIISVVVLSFFLAVRRQMPSAREVQLALGTICEIEIVTPELGTAKKLIKEGFDLIKGYEAKFSIYENKSEVSQVNKFAAVMSVSITRETYDVIKQSLDYSKTSGGLFDVTILPLVKVWGFDSKEFKKPSPGEIEDARACVGWDKVMLTDSGGECSLRFLKPDMQIDLGGIAKGYICDKVCELFSNAGLKDFIVNIGGNICSRGVSRKRQPWVIGVRNPRDRSEIIEQIVLDNEATATSGDYERYFIDEGIRYSHILNPRTGYPVQGVIAVTVVAATGVLADAASTIMFLTPRGEREDMFKKIGLKRALVFEETVGGSIIRLEYNAE